MFIKVCLVLALVGFYCSSVADSLGIFPRKFKFGVATSAYQVEGGWDAQGKGVNIWDQVCHTNPGFIRNEDNGDIACDSYNNWQEDVLNLKYLGVDFYRFSLSWSRILPTGRKDQVNLAGITYYRNLIQALIDNGIEPMVTLFHWDLPQPLEEIGGWLNPDLVDIFADYSTIAFEEFGDLVKSWITINEPKQICQGGYGEGNKAPGIVSSGLKEYECAHTVIKAHAKAWHIYDEQFRPTQKGRISITTDTPWFDPSSNDQADVEAAERMLQFTHGWFANPIYNRDYPQVMIDRIDARSAGEGLAQSRLPKFTEEELDYISGTHDFLGINVYTSALAGAKLDAPFGTISFANDVGVQLSQDPVWESTDSPYFKVVPFGMRKLLKWLKNTYNDPEIIITENGYVDHGGMVDLGRVNYHRQYLRNVLDAILYDGVNCTGYTAWSLMDNFEWTAGYGEKFGLYFVDFTDPARKRMPKYSAHWYSTLVKTHVLL